MNFLCKIADYTPEIDLSPLKLSKLRTALFYLEKIVKAKKHLKLTINFLETFFWK